MTTAVEVRRPARRAGQTASRWRDDLVTVLLGLWLLLGLFVDGWAHNNLARLETFFTPWHALFYSGYLVNTLWLLWLIHRGRQTGRVGLAALPQGYELGLVGALIFAAGGLGDMLWHLAFGIERDRAALLSPTHLLLFTGLTLIVTSPLRSAWATHDPGGNAPALRTFLPPLLSLTAATAFAVFMNGYLWAFIRPGGARQSSSTARDLNLAMILISNLLLLAPVLLLLRRWRIPFGSITILFTVIAVMASAVVAFRYAEYVPVAIVGGLAADGLVRALRPWPERPWALRCFATAVPLILWGLYFLVTWLRWGIGWSAELWAGVTVMAGLSGLGLSILMVPPAVPARA